MNKRIFLKTCLLAAIGSLLPFKSFGGLFKKQRPKIGYLSIKTCRDIGTRPGEWGVISNKTNKDEFDHIAIQEINDKTGLISGYKRDYGCEEGPRTLIKEYHDFRLVYDGKNPKYKHFV